MAPYQDNNRPVFTISGSTEDLQDVKVHKLEQNNNQLEGKDEPQQPITIQDQPVPIQDQPISVVQHKPIKEGRQLFRWNLVFNLLVLVIVPLPIWIPFVSNSLSFYLLPSIQGLFVLFWLIIVILALKNVIKLYMYQNFSYREHYANFGTPETIEHMFVISCYKEPVAVIAASLETIAIQSEARDKITMTVSFEERTPDKVEKSKQLRCQFESRFRHLFFTFHPYGMQNEIPGKCSNANYGIRQTVDLLQSGNPDFDPTRIIVTTCDADSMFNLKYTEALTYEFLKSPDSLECVFQAPLFYNWGLDRACVVTRVTSLIRTTLMLGALIPFNINSMSIFSFSLNLCIDGNFIHPAYQMDDIIALIRWMGVTKKSLKIRMISVPVISGPTSGEVVEEEIEEWARQARRWTIGAAEVFHYFAVKSGNIPFLARSGWAVVFMVYYGVLLCTSGLYSVTFGVSMNVLVRDVPLWVNFWVLGLVLLQYLCFAVIFIVDFIGQNLTNMKERICILRNLYHFVLTPFVLIAYSLVELFALFEVAVRGKKVCKHGASKKDSLVNLAGIV